jgi:phosphoglucomutase/phosphomannomutase
VRPSGTEPKVKFYFFSCLSPDASKDLLSAKLKLTDRLASYRNDIQSFAKSATQ